jgi:hypothetical protein
MKMNNAIQKAREALASIPHGAIDALANNQRQLDMDGCEVGVSRQAVDEVLAGLRAALAALDAETPATPADVGEEPVAYYWTEGRTSPDTPMGPAEYDEEVIFDFQPPAPGVQFEPLYSATALERVTRERDEARAENTRLRAALAQSELPCVYCTLPKDEWAKCAQGFPGCGRADDAMGCPELGAAMRAESAEAKLAEARKVIEPFARVGDKHHSGYLDTEFAYPIIRVGDVRAASRWLEETK